ncbi:hypothetical protein Tco_0593652 [Tanacetum coccineum]
MSKKQDCTAMSSVEAEYVALSASCAQVMWMRTQLKDYGFNYNKIPLYCDSRPAIAISCNPVQHSRTKHIHTRYHFIKEHVENGIIELYFIRTEYQLADMFTKALPEDRFQYLVRRIGEDATRAIPNMGFHLVYVESVCVLIVTTRLSILYLEIEVMCVEFGCHFEVELECKFTLSPLDVLQGFSFFLQMGFTLILATFDGFGCSVC